MATEVRMALIIEYDGSCYRGFQYQKNHSSIQEEVEAALEKLTSQNIKISGAGRTDAGVHALGQVIAFNLNTDLMANQVLMGLNHYLPRDIVVKTAYEVDKDFDPRRMAVSRIYKYSILNRKVRSPLQLRYSTLIRESLDIEEMRHAAEVMLGTHDFGAFAGALPKSTDSTIRNISKLEITMIGEKIEIEVEGNAFLPHQVRRMVGAIIDVGLGKISVDYINMMLDSKNKKIKTKTKSMPPQGLCLVAVSYKTFPPSGQ
ncbi:MAG: tRNA pseudouridine(38-40) synthase TruA [Dehalococcoidia bacterium]|nr:tRNA pseudouridine(38-40) synthase TruA [Dehalococcoidia bacterium]MQG16414.1 tRNA pseudouridine(38-40) synthase TruA [SAR202 cluster bacterium]|tara:strand:+ start:11083 stop:11859 length:777 start_codon:yes stop_codon:yes gene_type:complete